MTSEGSGVGSRYDSPGLVRKDPLPSGEGSSAIPASPAGPERASSDGLDRAEQLKRVSAGKSGWEQLLDNGGEVFDVPGLREWIRREIASGKGKAGEWTDPSFVLRALLDRAGVETVARGEGGADAIAEAVRLVVVKAGRKGVSTKGVQDRTGRARTTVKRAIKTLEEEGKIERVGDGYQTRYRVSGGA